MSLSSLIVVTALLIYMAEAQLNFNYLRQDEWGDFCNLPTSRRQTPINIVTADVEENSDLIPLDFASGWDGAVDGIVRNGGINLGFFADENVVKPILRNHLGNYEHLQFHMHWGSEDNTGSGHRIDGIQYGLEFHWVNVKQNSNFSFATASNESDVDVLSVLSVLAEANDSMPISGVWAQMDPTMITNNGDTFDVTGLRYFDLLPANRDYYYATGGFTSPTCLEINHWFVLKEKIQVPSDYLAQLRTMLFDSGQPMLVNHRDPQPLYERTVSCVTTDAAEKQATSLAVLISSVLFVSISIFI